MNLTKQAIWLLNLNSEITKDSYGNHNNIFLIPKATEYCLYVCLYVRYDLVNGRVDRSLTFRIVFLGPGNVLGYCADLYIPQITINKITTVDWNCWWKSLDTGFLYSSIKKINKVFRTTNKCFLSYPSIIIDQFLPSTRSLKALFVKSIPRQKFSKLYLK